MSNIKYTTFSQGQSRMETLIWTLPNFINLLKNKSTREFRTENPKDATAEAIDSKFQLKMKFLGQNNDIIEIYYLSPNSVFLKTILSKLPKRSQEISIAKEEYHEVQGNKWQYLATLSKRDIYGPKTLRADGSLQLQFDVIVSNDTKVESSNVLDTIDTQLSFEYLLSNGLFSDVTMRSAEGDEYKAHKAVLASRSDVLKAHFEHNTIECQTNVVESSFQAEVLTEVLTYIYSNKAPRVNEIPERLLAAADYYQLIGLKSLCEEALHKRLTVENAIETLQLADLHFAKRLKQLTLEFIKDGHAKLITKTEGWAKFKTAELIKAMYEFIIADDVEADI